jgi:hypothetical protein
MHLLQTNSYKITSGLECTAMSQHDIIWAALQMQSWQLPEQILCKIILQETLWTNDTIWDVMEASIKLTIFSIVKSCGWTEHYCVSEEPAGPIFRVE